MGIGFQRASAKPSKDTLSIRPIHFCPIIAGDLLEFVGALGYHPNQHDHFANHQVGVEAKQPNSTIQIVCPELLLPFVSDGL
ncbi:hypothetical protein PtA15_3A52 [Puccinia triticina]|uniref:Uncharacterized protein n=1 Tax=Puccinia triticina TaxID=208348 RepID=A0ABY7CDC2_9BASI|nr:uncharacterized protein PtA15_3A52 [Puccinia triticina]WAQ82689.1 hypothetical protein PtA15_3A52 [Puccinia triticina]